MRLAIALLALLAGCRCGGGPATQHVASISVADPGASAEDIEQAIVLPLERAVAAIDGVTALRARSEQGRATLVVESEREDIALAVQERVSAMLLPATAEPPVISKVDPDAPFDLAFRITGEHAVAMLSELARARIKPGLERIAGVGEIAIRGDARRTIKVHVDPMRLASHGITLVELATAIERTDTQLPAGRIVDTGAQIRVVGPLADLAALETVVIGSRADAPVRIADVARVEHASTSPREPLQLDVRLQRGIDRDAVTAAIGERLATVRAELPAGVVIAEEPIEPPRPTATLQGPDRAFLEAQASRLGVAKATPRIQISIDRAEATRLGVAIAQITRTIEIASGARLGELDRDDIVASSRATSSRRCTCARAMASWSRCAGW